MEHNGNGATGELERLALARSEIRRTVDDVVRSTPVIDIHTHLFAPEFGELNLYGIDNLLTYHYLVAEMFRVSQIVPDKYWAMTRTEQADLVWRSLFVENTPVSEAARGVITVLSSFGLDTAADNLGQAREFFRSRPFDVHIDDVLEKACVDSMVMTNDLFDQEELEVWECERESDTRFKASLRMDRMLNTWPYAAQFLSGADHNVDLHLSGSSISEVRRYIDKWIERMKPLYMAVSLPDEFQFPAGDIRNRLLNEVVLPTSRVHGLPFAMMIGVRRGVNPALRAAGDGVGRADVSAVERMCVENPDVRFLTTFLSRENQHELCVAARKFGNLMPFGCWWFLNNPSIVAEITTERLELLGTNFIPQHSDARVLEQLIYKWKHSRGVIADCLANSYDQLALAGRVATRAEIERDVGHLFAGNFQRIVGSGETVSKRI
jgi:hypothetical protein